MSSMLEQLWPVFLADVGEKLDAAETMITQALTTNAPSTQPFDVDAVFREFHTLKSSLSMVDFSQPMAIAHACEDILHGLRKSTVSPTRDMLTCLLASVDWIKQQVALAAPGVYPPHSNEVLLTKLAHFRPQEDEANAPITTEEKMAATSPSDNIAEEKEALEIDTLRIHSDSLDELVTLINSMILTEYRSENINNKAVTDAIQAAQHAIDNAESNNSQINFYSALENLINTFSHYQSNLLKIDDSIRQLCGNIQESVLGLRIIPLSTIFTRLPRIVRQKASAQEKSVQLTTEGGDIAIDKGMIDIVSETLIHLLHNAITHGLETSDTRKAHHKSETGLINITAKREGDILHLDIHDDGAGIDIPAIRDKVKNKGILHDANRTDDHYWLNFLFTRGFNSDLPGRTTGLDKVHDELVRIGGSIQIYSQRHRGTHFSLRFPVTVAIQNALVVQAHQLYFAIPSRHVIEILSTTSQTLTTTDKHPMLQLRGNTLPIYLLADLLQLPDNNSIPSQRPLLIVLQHDQHVLALQVDNILGRQDLFLRQTHQDLRSIPGVGGISLLGNGNVIIILDCENLFQLTHLKHIANHVVH